MSSFIHKYMFKIVSFFIQNTLNQGSLLSVTHVALPTQFKFSCGSNPIFCSAALVKFMFLHEAKALASHTHHFNIRATFRSIIQKSLTTVKVSCYILYLRVLHYHHRNPLLCSFHYTNCGMI